MSGVATRSAAAVVWGVYLCGSELNMDIEAFRFRVDMIYICRYRR